MPTFRERFTGFIKKAFGWIISLFAPASFSIVDDQREMYFVTADRLTVSKSGRLLFWRHGAVCAVVAEGQWRRVLKGITLDDVKAVED
jgi:hypothetical protein